MFFTYLPLLQAERLSLPREHVQTTWNRWSHSRSKWIRNWRILMSSMCHSGHWRTRPTKVGALIIRFFEVNCPTLNPSSMSRMENLWYTGRVKQGHQNRLVTVHSCLRNWRIPVWSRRSPFLTTVMPQLTLQLQLRNNYSIVSFFFLREYCEERIDMALFSVITLDEHL